MDLMEMGKKAVEAKYCLQKLTESEKNKALLTVADTLVKDSEKILAANAIDIKTGQNSHHRICIVRRSADAYQRSTRI